MKRNLVYSSNNRMLLVLLFVLVLYVLMIVLTTNNNTHTGSIQLIAGEEDIWDTDFLTGNVK